MLSRTEKLKCTLMKVGEMYGLPLDLMKQVYRFKMELEEEDRGRERMFQKNVILMTIFSRPGDGWIENLERIWLNRYKRITKQFNFEEDDVYATRITSMPGTVRHCPRPEWSFWIKSSPYVAQIERGPAMGNRGRLMKCIKILGEDRYLWEAIYDVQSNSHVISRYEPCSLKRKIKYLNTSCWDEIGRDYDNFVTDAYASRLLVDCWGDSYYLD
jgi:hypothetical protein